VSAGKVDVLTLDHNTRSTLADELLPLAQRELAKMDSPSLTKLQRVLRIGYNRAARLMEAFHAIGWLNYNPNNGEYSHVDRAALARTGVSA